MPSLGPMEILVILVVALLVLGPTKLPEAGRQVGRAMAEFRRWSSGFQQEIQDALDPEPQPAPPSATSGAVSSDFDEVPTPADLEPSPSPDGDGAGPRPSGE